MKKLTLLLSLTLLSCGKFKQRDILFHNSTPINIIVESTDLACDMMVLSDGGQYVTATKGQYAFHAYSDNGIVDYYETVKVTKDGAIVELHY